MININTTDGKKLVSWVFLADVTRVVDGDTYHVIIDHGLRIFSSQILRLHDLDTPETYRPKGEVERSHGKEATQFVKDWIVQTKQKITAVTYPTMTYGRWVADVYNQDGDSLAIVLRSNGFSKKTQAEYEEIFAAKVVNNVI